MFSKHTKKLFFPCPKKKIMKNTSKRKRSEGNVPPGKACYHHLEDGVSFDVCVCVFVEQTQTQSEILHEHCNFSRRKSF